MGVKVGDELILKPGYGYWDTTAYPIGGNFRRAPRSGDGIRIRVTELIKPPYKGCDIKAEILDKSLKKSRSEGRTMACDSKNCVPAKGVRGESRKLKKGDLRKIIREEYRKILTEAESPDKLKKKAYDSLEQIEKDALNYFNVLLDTSGPGTDRNWERQLKRVAEAKKTIRSVLEYVEKELGKAR